MLMKTFNPYVVNGQRVIMSTKNISIERLREGIKSGKLKGFYIPDDVGPDRKGNFPVYIKKELFNEFNNLYQSLKK